LILQEKTLEKTLAFLSVLSLTEDTWNLAVGSK